MVERSTGRKLKVLRSDNGGEYTSGEFVEHLMSEGIRHELTVPKSPQQNGVAERLNRTLVMTVYVGRKWLASEALGGDVHSGVFEKPESLKGSQGNDSV